MVQTKDDHRAPRVGFFYDDDLWAVMWPAAIGVAVVVHGAAYFLASAQPAKVRPPPVTMAIQMPPPPLPPSSSPEPPPEPPKPQKKRAEALPPLPAAVDVPASPAESPPPIASPEVVALAPASGEGVAVPVGSSDGVGGAPIAAASGPPPTTNQGAAGPPSETWDPRGYRDGAWDKLNQAKRYPRKAQVLGLEGKCIVKVLVNHDGSLAAKPTLVGKGTGHDVLDEECLAMAERVQFGPIPAHVQAPVTFRFPIDFMLQNR
jgi:protein TonB